MDDKASTGLGEWSLKPVGRDVAFIKNGLIMFLISNEKFAPLFNQNMLYISYSFAQVADWGLIKK